MGVVKVIATVFGVAVTIPQAYIFIRNARVLKELNYALENQSRPNAFLRILYRCERRNARLNLLISGAIITVCTAGIVTLLTH